MNIYKLNGYSNRENYLKFLAAEYNVSFDTVNAMCKELGSVEAFDGLIDELEEYCQVRHDEETYLLVSQGYLKE